jgi:hypothetical protein
LQHFVFEFLEERGSWSGRHGIEIYLRQLVAQVFFDVLNKEVQVADVVHILACVGRVGFA